MRLGAEGRRAVRADAAPGCGPCVPVHVLGRRGERRLRVRGAAPARRGPMADGHDPAGALAGVHPGGLLRVPATGDGRRLVTTVFFQVARKSAKSTLVAAVALYHLAVEQEPGAQVICGATTGSQARDRLRHRPEDDPSLAVAAGAGLHRHGERHHCSAMTAPCAPINAQVLDTGRPESILHQPGRIPRAGLRAARRAEVRDGRSSGRGALGPTTAGYS